MRHQILLVEGATKRLDSQKATDEVPAPNPVPTRGMLVSDFWRLDHAALHKSLLCGVGSVCMYIRFGRSSLAKRHQILLVGEKGLKALGIGFCPKF